MSEEQKQFYHKIYKKYYSLLFRYGMSYLGNEGDVEDCLQATFTIALEKIDELEKHDNVVGWLVQTLKHRMKKLLRRKKRWGDIVVSLEDATENLTIEDLPDTVSLEDGLLDYESELENFRTILSEREYEIFKAHYIDGEPYRSIAERLELRENAAYVYGYRAKQKIMRFYEKDE